jgi:hypothetical protein
MQFKVRCGGSSKQKNQSARRLQIRTGEPQQDACSQSRPMFVWCKCTSGYIESQKRKETPAIAGILQPTQNTSWLYRVIPEKQKDPNRLGQDLDGASLTSTPTTSSLDYCTVNPAGIWNLSFGTVALASSLTALISVVTPELLDFMYTIT